MSARSAITRLAVAMVVAASGLLSGSTPASAKAVGTYWIEAKRPPSGPNYQLFVGVGPTDRAGSAVRLWSYRPPATTPADRDRLLWRVEEWYSILTKNGTTTKFLSYRFYNRKTGRCLSYTPPMSIGIAAIQREVPAGSSCRGYALDNGVKRVGIGDATGQRYGFKLVLPLLQRWCLDVRERRYQAGTMLQWWSCHNGYNQKFVLRTAPSPAVSR